MLHNSKPVFHRRQIGNGQSPMTRISSRRGAKEPNRKSLCKISPTCLFIFSLFGASVGILLWANFATSGYSLGGNPVPVTQGRKSSAFSKERADRSADLRSMEEISEPSDRITIHVVFSTDCGSFQHWQSYLLFYSAMKIGQAGYVTRIASGCSDEEKATLRSWHETHVTKPMSEKYTVHFTPHFSSVTQDGDRNGKQYKFFNKPFGLQHWMNHGEHMGVNSNGKIKRPDDIVVLLDPDQIILRPFDADFTNEKTTIVSGPAADRTTRRYRVEHGHPFGQHYGFGGAWTSLDTAKITGDPNSPATKISRQEARKSFAVGPPYIGTARDMYAIANKWAEFAPRVHEQLPSLMAEMYAYCSAASHLELPHQRFDHGMVSAVDANGEGWAFVDALSTEETCTVDHGGRTLPMVIHYCQRYIVGGFKFAKRSVPHNFFECGHPLLKEPPPDLAEILWKETEKQALDQKMAKRTAFVTCTAIKTLNEAAEFFKNNGCDGKENREKSFQIT